MVKPETAEALTIAALAVNDTQLALEDEDERNAANELGSIADRMEYSREEVGDAETAGLTGEVAELGEDTHEVGWSNSDLREARVADADTILAQAIRKRPFTLYPSFDQPYSTARASANCTFAAARTCTRRTGRV